MQSLELRELIREHADELEVSTAPVSFQDLEGPRQSERRVLPRPARSTRPAWALLFAFATTLLVVGVPLMVGLLTRVEEVPVGATPTSPPSTVGQVSGLEGFAIGLGVGLIVLLAVTAIRRIAIGMNGGVAMTTTMTRESGDTEIRSLKRTNRILLTTAIVLALLAIGFGAWAIYAANAEPENAATEEINALVDDYTAAWNNYDGDAFLELVTDDYVLDADMGEVGPGFQARQINNLDVYDWQVEILGDMAMTGTGPWYVAMVNRITGFPGADDGFSILTVVEEDGTMKVAEHVWIGD